MEILFENNQIRIGGNMTNKKICIVNGSPRNSWNTAKMCQSFAQGVTDIGLEVEIINLYDIDFKGCRSCFACKLRNGKNYGKCAYPDGLKDILDRVSGADGIVFASPVYFGEVTGVMKSFCERLFFPFVTYDEKFTPIPPKNLKTAVIYTMNVDKSIFETSYLGDNNCGPIGLFENWISHIYEQPQRICAFNTYQFSDYNKYVADVFDETQKAKQRDEVFPQDLQKAYLAGENMAKELL